MRLIDADALEDRLEEVWQDCRDKNEFTQSSATLYCRWIVHKMPTIKAELAVRCRDCMHLRGERNGFLYCNLYGFDICEEDIDSICKNVKKKGALHSAAEDSVPDTPPGFLCKDCRGVQKNPLAGRTPYCAIFNSYLNNRDLDKPCKWVKRKETLDGNAD